MALKLPAAQYDILREAQNPVDGYEAKNDGWFPEFRYNGRMKRSLDALVAAGFLQRERRTSSSGWSDWYKLTPQGRAIRLV